MKKALLVLSLLVVGCSKGNLQIIEACGETISPCAGYLKAHDLFEQPEKYVFDREFEVQKPQYHRHYIFFVR